MAFQSVTESKNAEKPGTSQFDLSADDSACQCQNWTRIGGDTSRPMAQLARSPGDEADDHQPNCY
jgi:hypothetical protein